MSKFETTFSGDFRGTLARIERGILDSSVSAALEDSSDYESGTTRCSVRVFYRYSYLAGGHVSMNVTLLQEGGGPIHLSAITAGGKRARTFNIKTPADRKFLDTLIHVLD